MKKSKPGRPSLQSGRTPNISLRLPLKLATTLDRWRKRQPGAPNRNESIRWLLEFALSLDPKSDGKDQG
jgi:hypothetical protein